MTLKTTTVLVELTKMKILDSERMSFKKRLVLQGVNNICINLYGNKTKSWKINAETLQF